MVTVSHVKIFSETVEPSLFVNHNWFAFQWITFHLLNFELRRTCFRSIIWSYFNHCPVMWAYFTWVHLFFVTIYLISFTSGYQMRLKEHYEINSKISENEIDDSRIENVNSKINDCRKTALWSCGNVLLKASKFLDYLIGKESLYAKCSMKKAFLNCLNETSSKKCGRKRGHLHKLSHKFKQKVAQVLWSTRNCYFAPFFANQLET